MPYDESERIELELKDHIGITRSNSIINIAWIRELQKRADRFSHNAVTISFKNIINNSVITLTFLVAGLLFLYGILFHIWNNTLPDPLIAATLSMVMATLLMAYLSKKGLDTQYIERLRPLAEEAITSFLIPLKQNIEKIGLDLDHDEPINISPELFEPKPHLLIVTYEEKPLLYCQTAKLIKAILRYNVSINPKEEEYLRNSVRRVLNEISELETKLSKKYFAKSGMSSRSNLY